MLNKIMFCPRYLKISLADTRSFHACKIFYYFSQAKVKTTRIMNLTDKIAYSNKRRHCC